MITHHAGGDWSNRSKAKGRQSARERESSEEAQQPWHNPYDFGAWANFREVLGGNMFLWFVPVRWSFYRTRGAAQGLTFRRNERQTEGGAAAGGVV